MRTIIGPIACCLFIASTVASAQAEAQLQGYEFHMSVIQTDGKKSVTVVEPSVTVRQDQPTVVSIEAGGAVYAFEVEVTRQAGELVGSTKVRITQGGKMISSPRLTRHIGQAAWIEIADFKITVDVQLAKG